MASDVDDKEKAKQDSVWVVNHIIDLLREAKCLGDFLFIFGYLDDEYYSGAMKKSGCKKLVDGLVRYSLLYNKVDLDGVKESIDELEYRLKCFPSMNWDY